MAGDKGEPSPFFTVMHVDVEGTKGEVHTMLKGYWTITKCGDARVRKPRAFFLHGDGDNKSESMTKVGRERIE